MAIKIRMTRHGAKKRRNIAPRPRRKPHKIAYPIDLYEVLQPASELCSRPETTFTRHFADPRPV